MTVNTYLIKDLENALAGVLTISAELKTRGSHRQALISILRKLRIARELASVYYICIAGSQSAGKTRLVRELYSLDESWLADNQGRGERVPVFIIEKDCDEPKAFAVRYTEAGEEQEVEISKEEFREIVSAYDANDLRLFPKLYVPRRYFQGASCGFVLLPGYETLNADNAQWQGLMRHTLTHSLGSILVTDRTRIADSGQKQILSDLLSRYFPDRKPIIAVTKTEDFTQQQKDELTTTVREVFEIHPAESNRVVCTGVREGDEAYRETWCKQLINIVNTYALTSAGSDEGRLHELEKILDLDLEAATDALESELASESISEHLTERQVEKVQQLFQKSVERYRHRYAKKLRENTLHYSRSAQRVAEDKYIAEEESVVAKLKQAGNFLTFQSGENERRFKDRIVECWRNGDGELKSPLESDYLAISEMSSNELGVRKLQDGGKGLQVLKEQGLEKMMGYDVTSVTGPAQSAEELHHDLRLLLSHSRANDVKTTTIERLKDSRVENVLKALPAMTMEYFRLNQAMAIKLPELARSELESFNFEKLAVEINRDLPKVSQSIKPLLSTMAAILAVDVAIDGTLDTIPAIAGTLTGGAGAGTAAATGLGATLSMAAAGIITLGFIAYRGASEVQQYDAARKGFIAQCMAQFAESHIQKGLEIYDDLMENLQERLTANLRLAYGLGTEISTKDALARSLNRLACARVNLVKAIDDVQIKRVA
jgi:hypothetical protein